jgi:enoyl-CoA hydratase/carnithine racemase
MTYDTSQFDLPSTLVVEFRRETAVLRLARAKKRNAIKPRNSHRVPTANKDAELQERFRIVSGFLVATN